MSTKVFTATPVISAAGIYASGDAVGGLIEFENVCSAFEASAKIVGAILIDNDKESVHLHLLLFNQTFTATADNSPMDVTDSDLANVIGVIHFQAADYVALNDNSVCFSVGHGDPQLNVPIVLKDGGTSLFGQLVAEATPTYTAVNDLTVKLVIER